METTATTTGGEDRAISDKYAARPVFGIPPRARSRPADLIKLASLAASIPAARLLPAASTSWRCVCRRHGTSEIPTVVGLMFFVKRGTVKTSCCVSSSFGSAAEDAHSKHDGGVLHEHMFPRAILVMQIHSVMVARSPLVFRYTPLLSAACARAPSLNSIAALVVWSLQTPPRPRKLPAQLPPWAVYIWSTENDQSGNQPASLQGQRSAVQKERSRVSSKCTLSNILNRHVGQPARPAQVFRKNAQPPVQKLLTKESLREVVFMFFPSLVQARC